MKRVIKNYNTIEAHHIALIEESYPLGISQEDIISLRMPDGKYLSCLEVKTDDTVYLFRMDGGMIQMLEEETTTTTRTAGTTEVWTAQEEALRGLSLGA
jgi:hypothetical protein